MPLMVMPIGPSEVKSGHNNAPGAAVAGVVKFTDKPPMVYHVRGYIASKTAAGAPATIPENVSVSWKVKTIILSCDDAEIEFVDEMSGDVSFNILATDTNNYTFVNITMTPIAYDFTDLAARRAQR